MTEENVESVVVRIMAPGEAASACALIRDVFSEFVAPYYDDEGVAEFLEYIDAKKMADRSLRNHITLLAFNGSSLAGVLEMRDSNHISLLFVAREFQHQGIARRVLDQALKIAREQIPDLVSVSVNSSPNSLIAYKKLGFRVNEPEKVINGIRFTPMTLEIK